MHDKYLKKNIINSVSEVDSSLQTVPALYNRQPLWIPSDYLYDKWQCLATLSRSVNLSRFRVKIITVIFPEVHCTVVDNFRCEKCFETMFFSRWHLQENVTMNVITIPEVFRFRLILLYYHKCFFYSSRSAKRHLQHEISMKNNC